MEISKLLVKLIRVLQRISGDVAQKVAAQSRNCEHAVCFDLHFFSVQLNCGVHTRHMYSIGVYDIQTGTMQGF